MGIVLLLFYILCALIRLAFFNVLETKRQMREDGCAKAYRGLPVTTAAIVFPIIYFVGVLLPAGVTTVIYYVLPLLMGTLFITDIRIPKLDVSRLWRRSCEEQEQENEKIHI